MDRRGRDCVSSRRREGGSSWGFWRRRLSRALAAIVATTLRFMSSPSSVLTPRISAAIVEAFGSDFRGTDPVLRSSQFADVQVNAALALAKRVGEAPRNVAAKIVKHLDLEGVCANTEVIGPGFLNLTRDNGWIAGEVTRLAADARLSVPAVEVQRIPIDYSAPNVAKEMHVGHLRTTVIGDARARTLEHLGHTVIRQNHIGISWSSRCRHLLVLPPPLGPTAARGTLGAARVRVLGALVGGVSLLLKHRGRRSAI